MSPDDSAFWEGWFPEDVVRPAGWDQFSAVERCIVVHDGGGLDEALAYYLGRPRWQGWLLCSDAEAIQHAVPEFRAAAERLIRERHIQLRLLPSESSDWDDSPATDVSNCGSEPNRSPAARASLGSGLLRRRSAYRRIGPLGCRLSGRQPHAQMIRLCAQSAARIPTTSSRHYVGDPCQVDHGLFR